MLNIEAIFLWMVLIVVSASHSNNQHINEVSLKCDGVYSILSMKFVLTVINVALFQ